MSTICRISNIIAAPFVHAAKSVYWFGRKIIWVCCFVACALKNVLLLACCRKNVRVFKGTIHKVNLPYVEELTAVTETILEKKEKSKSQEIDNGQEDQKNREGTQT